jgi:hypothetical protein
MIKWPPDPDYLKNSTGFEQIEKLLTRYMKINNLKMEEINYIYYMLNTFIYLNKPEING